MAAAERFFRYMLNAGIDKQTFERRVQTVASGKLLNYAMKLADQYRQEGREQGRQEGREQGRQEGMERGELKTLHRMLLDVLATRFEVVPEGLVELLNGINDKAVLSGLMKEAVRCNSLNDFAEKL